MTHLGNKNKCDFQELATKFDSPPMYYAPYEFWFWDQQLDQLGYKPSDMACELARKGFNPGYAHARVNYADMLEKNNPYIRPIPRDEWLSERWFEEIRKVMEQARSDGSSFCITDDFDWPSFQAAGRVLEKYPDMYARSLNYSCVDVKNGETVTIPSEGFSVAGKIAETHPIDYISFDRGQWNNFRRRCWDKSEPHQVETCPYDFAMGVSKDADALATYHPYIRQKGVYRLYARWGDAEWTEGTCCARYTVVSNNSGVAPTTFTADQSTGMLHWNLLGEVYLESGDTIEVTKGDSEGALCVDAIKLEKDDIRIVIDELQTLQRTACVVVPGTLRRLSGELFTARDGDWRVYSFRIERTVGYDGNKVDDLDTRLAERYSEIAYKPYFEKLPEFLGADKPFNGFFADTEGGFGFKLAWSEDLEKRYYEHTGRELIPDIPLLFDASEDGQEAVVRCAWFEAASDIFAGQFACQSKLCAEHGMYYTMHTWEESLPFQANQVGSLFKICRAVSLPGTDCLEEVAYNPANFWDTLSVAEFEGRRFMTEMMACEQAPKYSFRELKKQVNYLAAWGVSHIIVHAVKMTRRLAFLALPPDFYNIDPAWKYMKYWTDYVRRICFINSGGRLDAHTVVYNPMESVWAMTDGANTHPDYFMYSTLKKSGVGAHTASHGGEASEVNRNYHELIRELARRRVTFLTADHEYFRQMRVNGGRLELSGFSFDTVILPCMTVIDRTAAESIVRFAENGGRVIFLDRVPAGSPQGGAKDEAIIELMKRLTRLATVEISALEELQAIAPCVSFNDGEFRLTALARTVENKRVIWLANNEDISHSSILRIPGIHGGATKFDPLTGRITPVCGWIDGSDTVIKVRLESIEGFFVCIDPCTEPERSAVKEKVLSVITDYTEFIPEHLPRSQVVHELSRTTASGLRIIVRRALEKEPVRINDVRIYDGESLIITTGAMESERPAIYEDCQCFDVPFSQSCAFDRVEVTGAGSGVPWEYRIEACGSGKWHTVVTYYGDGPCRMPENTPASRITEKHIKWRGLIPAGATHLKAEGVVQAAELFVNGLSAGVCIAEPFIYDISGLYKETEENELELAIAGRLTRDAALEGKLSFVKLSMEQLLCF